VLFQKLRQVVYGELPPQNAQEREVFDGFTMMLEEIEMLCTTNKIRKHSRTRALSMEEAQEPGKQTPGGVTP
jgi:hypothetical protein